MKQVERNTREIHLFMTALYVHRFIDDPSISYTNGSPEAMKIWSELFDHSSFSTTFADGATSFG